MYTHQSTNHCMIPDGNMSGKRRGVSHDDVIADVTIMRHVHVGHQKIMPADRRDAATERRPAVHRHVLPQNIFIADTHARRLIMILEVLGRSPD